MRPRRVAPLVAALVLTAAAAPAHAAPPVKRLAKPATTAPTPAKPAEILRKAERALRSTASPRHGRSVSPLLKDLAEAVPRMTPAQRTRANRLLARPTDGASDPQGGGWTTPEAPNSPYCSANFCVHWTAVGSDAPDLTDANANAIPDWVEKVSQVSENVHSVENGQLGWREPKSDGILGGGSVSGLTDIYLKNIGADSIYGYTAPDPGQRLTDADHSTYAYLVLDDDFSKAEFPTYPDPVVPLEVTVAHEYNHVIQFAYDSLEDTWMFESTAVWMEGKVYEAAHDYLQYLPGWVQLTTQPLTAFNGVDPNDRTNVKVYGSAVWNKWLEARFGQDVVRQAWEESIDTNPQSFALDAYDAAIRAHGGQGVVDQFDRFATATAEWQAPDSGFPEGSLWPDVDRVGGFKLNGSAGEITLDHTGYALIDVTPTTAKRIKLAMIAPRGTEAALALVGLKGGDTTRAIRELPKGGRATVTLPAAAGFDRVTAVLINSDPRVTGYSAALADWVYAREGQRFFASASTDFRRPRVKSRSPHNGARASRRPKVKVVFSEPVIGVTRKSFQLVGGGKVVPAKVRFVEGGRRASLVPRRRLKSGRRYRVRLTNAVSDVALNRLRRPPAWAFRAR